MLFRDYNPYFNNPTSDQSETTEYERGMIFNIGAIAMLPPVASFIMKRAAAFDRRRSIFYRIKEKQERMQMGYGSIKDQKVFSMMEEARRTGLSQEILKDIEEIRSMEVDPDSDEKEIKAKINRLLEKQKLFVEEIEKEPYSVYISKDDRRAARSRDIILFDNEHEKRKMLQGQSTEEALRSLEKTVVLMEHRKIVSSLHNPKTPDQLTIAGRKFYDGLDKTYRQAVGEGNYEIQILGSRAGTYDFKVTLKKAVGHLKPGEELIFSSHQFMGEHIAITQKRFDSLLLDAFRDSSGALRRVVRPMQVVDGKKTMLFHTQTAFQPGGSASAFFRFLHNALVNKGNRYGGSLETILAIRSQNLQHLDTTDISDSVGIGNDSSLNRTQIVLQERRYTPSDERQATIKAANVTKFSSKKIMDARDYQIEQNKAFHVGESQLMVQFPDGEVTTTGFHLYAPLSSAAGYPTGKVYAIAREERMEGGTPFGQQPKRANIVAGYGLDFMFKRKQAEIVMERLRRRRAGPKRKVAMRKELRFRNFDDSRYDLITMKRLAHTKNVAANDPLIAKSVAFRKENTLIMVGAEPERITEVSMDQVLRMQKYGGAGVTELVANPVVDIVEAQRAVVELYEHEVIYDPTGNNGLGKISYRNFGEKDITGALNDENTRKVIRLFEAAYRENRPYLIVTRGEAELLGITVDKRNKFTKVGDIAQGNKEYFYIPFEEHHGIRGGKRIRKFRLAGADNALRLNEENKIDIKATFKDGSVDRLQGRIDLIPNRGKSELKRLVASGKVGIVMGQTLLEKGFTLQQVEGAFGRVLEEIVSNELHGGRSAYRDYGAYAMAYLNNRSTGVRQAVYQFNRYEARRKGRQPFQKRRDVVRLANELYSLMVKGKRWDGTTYYIDSVVVTKQFDGNGNGKVVNVDYKINSKYAAAEDIASIDTRLSKAFVESNIKYLKEKEREITKILTDYSYRTRGTGLLYTRKPVFDSATQRYINSVAIVGREEGKKEEKILSLFLKLGHGTPEGHQAYSSEATEYVGKYMAMTGTKFNMYDIQSMTYINEVFGDYLKQVLHASFKRDKEGAHIAATLNRKLNFTALGAQTQLAKAVMRKARAAASRRASSDALMWKTKSEILMELEDEKYVPAKKNMNPEEVLDVIKQAMRSVASPDDTKSAIIKALRLDSFYIDSEEALKNLIEFKEKTPPVISDLIANPKSEIKGMRLQTDVALHTVSTGREHTRSDFLFYEDFRIETNMPKVETEDLLKNLASVREDQARKVEENLRRKILQNPERKYMLHMLDEKASAIIRLEKLNQYMKYLRELEKKGRPDGEVIREAILHMKGLIESDVNVIQKEMEKSGYGKTGTDFKIAYMFSGNYKIERMDDFAAAFGLDYKTVVIPRREFANMARSSFQMGVRSLGWIVGTDALNIVNELNARNIENIKEQLGYEGTRFAGIIDNAFSEIEEAIKVRGHAVGKRELTKKLAHAQRRIAYIKVLTENAQNPYEKRILTEAERLQRTEQFRSARTISELAELFSTEGFYGKIKGHLEKGATEERKRALKVWEEMFRIMEETKIVQRTPFVDTGRLWHGWTTIGEKLLDKTILREIKNATYEMQRKTADPGEVKALQRLTETVQALHEQYTRNRSEIGRKDYQRVFGKAADLMMTLADFGIGKLKKGRPISQTVESQLTKKEQVVADRAKKLSEYFMSFRPLVSAYEDMISFNTEEKVLELIEAEKKGAGLERLAEEKIDKLVRLARELSEKAIEKSKNSAAAKRFAERAAKFIADISEGERGAMFKKELISAMRFIHSAATVGVTGFGQAYPEIFSAKHMGQIKMRLILDKHILENPNLSDREKLAMIRSVNNGKMKISHILAGMMDRDFDNDPYGTTSTIIDERYGKKKGTLSVANTLGLMTNTTFTIEGNSIKPTNETAAVMMDLLFNEVKGAKRVVFENAYTYAKENLRRELSTVGFVDVDQSGRKIGMRAAMEEFLNKFLDRNDMKRGRNLKENIRIVRQLYAVKDIIEDPATDNSIKIVVNGKVVSRIDAKERANYTIDKYAEELMKEKGVPYYRTDRIGVNKLINMALEQSTKTERFITEMATQFDERFQSHVDKVVEEARAFELQDKTRFTIQKVATGELYKYPTMFRMLGDAMMEGKDGDIRKIGKLMKTMAEFSGYIFQQKVAIGMKKGGLDAVKGVHELFREIFSIAEINSQEARNKRVRELYQRITERGINIELSGSEKAIVENSQYARLIKMGAEHEGKFMSVSEMLKFSIAKQKALQAIIAGTEDKLTGELETLYGKSQNLDEFSRTLISAMRKRADELASMSRDKTVANTKELFRNMLVKEMKESTSIAEINKSMVKLTEMSLKGIIEITARAKSIGEFSEVKEMLRIAGDVVKDTSHQRTVYDVLRDSKYRTKHMGTNSSILQRFLSFVSSMENEQATRLIDAIVYGKEGPNISYVAEVEKRRPYLIGEKFSRKAAVLGLGTLALGVFAPSVTTGSDPGNVVDKNSEYSTWLAYKKIQSYNNQANVMKVNPWITNRLREEKFETARFNQFFYGTLTG